MQILVTGGSGFIGTYLTAKFRESRIPFASIRRGSSSTSVNQDSTISLEWPTGLNQLDLSGISAVVHLAVDKGTAQEPFPDDANTQPVRILIDRIRKTNPECLFIFLSSQSASAQPGTSPYGILKWKHEELLRKSGIRFSIIRPGLVYSASARGLFGAILKLIKISPVIPVLTNGTGTPFQIQPLLIHDLTKAIERLVLNPAQYNRCELFLSDKPVSFVLFLKSISAALGLSRFWLPVPAAMLFYIFKFTEKLFPRFPLGSTNLRGLTQLVVIDPEKSWSVLGMQPTPLQDGLRTEFTNTSVEVKKVATTASASKAHDDTQDALDLELQYLHSSLFPGMPTSSLRERYRQAHNFCCRATPHEAELMNTVVSRTLDPEAVELALRFTTPAGVKNIVTRKLLLVSYLAEVEGAYSEHYTASRTRRLSAWFILPLLVARTTFKAAYGVILLKRYGKCLTQ